MSDTQRPDERVEDVRGWIQQLADDQVAAEAYERLESNAVDFIVDLVRAYDATLARAERAERVVEAARPCRHILPVFVWNNEAVSRLDEALVAYDMKNRGNDESEGE